VYKNYNLTLEVKNRIIFKVEIAKVIFVKEL